jgi:TRAP transporter TAXI family solute receptor
MNAGTVGLISGGVDGTYIRIAADLANVLDSDTTRVLPIVGRGSLQNLRDIMFLRGVDMGIVQTDARDALRTERLGDTAERRLRYIAPLYNEEVHVLARREVADLRQLDRRKVNIDRAGSGTNLTARNIFSKLGMAPDYVELDQTSSYAALRAGEIAAAVYVAGRPVRGISDFSEDERFHLLGVPFTDQLAETYLPAQLTGADYPKLMDEGRPVQTLAVGSVLAVFNWPPGSERYRKVARFVDEFFSRFGEFRRPGRHPKWKDVNLSATVPGWERLKAAQDWLDAHRGPTAVQTPPAGRAASGGP